MSDWYCIVNGKQIGPIDAATLKKMGEDGDIQPFDHVARSPDGPWSEAQLVNGLTFTPRRIRTNSIVEEIHSEKKPVEYEYRMEQIAPGVLVQGQERGNEAALFLQQVVNRGTGDGWEFYRVDTFGVVVQPGCLGSLFGARVEYRNYYVATFRRVKA